MYGFKNFLKEIHKRNEVEVSGLKELERECCLSHIERNKGGVGFI